MDKNEILTNGKKKERKRDEGRCRCYGASDGMETCTTGDGKSLARPGRKQNTATKLGIYSKYPHNTLLSPLL